MKRFLHIVLCTLLASTASGQDWLTGSKGNFVSEALDVAVDANGNSVAIGYFSGVINFNDSTEQAVSGFSDILLAKFDPNGNMLWMQRFGGNQADRGHKVAFDAANNIYITGFFAGSMTMGATTLNSAGGSRDIFIAKLTPAGAVTWARADGGNQEETPNGLAVDAQGNVVITGRFEGNTNIGGTAYSSQINPATGTPSFDIFIAKYTTAGVPVWTKKGNTELDDTGLAVTCDNANNIYVTGQYSDTMTFITQTVYNQVNNAGYVAKLDPSGNLMWFDKLGATQTYAYAVKLNNAGELYLTGNFLGTMVLQTANGPASITNPYIKKIFLIKLNSSTGNLIWARAQGSDSDVSARGLTIDAAQDVYICGDFRCTFDEYRDLTDSGLWNTVGFRDVFVSKFAPNGQMQWHKHSGGKKEDLCYALANGGNDKPIFAGSFEGNFYIPTNVYNLTNPSFSPDNVVFNGDPAAAVGFLFYRMEGDLSKNMFVGKVNDVTNPNYYFYQPNPTVPGTASDTIPPDLYPQQDTVEFCNQMYLAYQQHWDMVVGPDFDFSWSGPNNDINPFLYVAYQNETVTVSSVSIDGCYEFHDTIVTIVHSSPPLPLMSDDHDFNNLQPVSYNFIHLCQPDTALVSFQNLAPNTTLEINYYNIPYHSGTDTFQVFTPGDYNVVVTDAFGCTSQGVFAVINDSVVEYDSIGPMIYLMGQDNLSDTITICEFETLQYIIIDTLTNPYPWAEVVYNQPFISETFLSPDFQPNMNGPHSIIFVPDSTDWYTVQYIATIGYDNACGVDTIKYNIIDSVYIVVNPNPAANLQLFSDSPICPGDSAYISVSQTMPGGMWTGGVNIVWQSPDQDSIQVSQTGYYSYAGSTTDTVTGCSSNFTVGTFVTEKIPPAIQMYPDDGLICPNSTIELSVVQAGTYEWFGPDGSSLGTGQSLIVSTPGLYSCYFVDPDGCGFQLEQVEITEYITPFLAYSPVNVFCETGEIELIPVYNGYADIVWLDPINATTETVVVTQPGTYYVEVTQCNTTTLDSVTIYDGQYTPVISATDMSLCPGGTVTLTTNPGMASYEWNGEFSTENTLTVTESGEYEVTMLSGLGCEETISITIGDHVVPPVPTIADQEVCEGSDVTLTDASGLPTAWYANLNDMTPEVSGPTYSIQNIAASTTVYVAHPHAVCAFPIDTVHVNVIDFLANPPIDGDAVLCEGEALSLQTDPNPDVTMAWVYGGDTLSETEFLQLPYSAFPASGNITLYIANACFEAHTTIALELIPEYPLVLNTEDDSACDYDFIELYATNGFSGMIYWQVGDDSVAANPLIVTGSDFEDSVFVAYGIDDDGCVTLPTTAILHFEDCTPKIPNVITVNGDGVNDYFIIPNAELMEGNTLIILNRWGNVMYEAENYTNGFDGKDVSDGVYFYYFYPDGKDGVRDPVHGFFHVVRN